jgi:excisionase family DNA binding protein
MKSDRYKKRYVNIKQISEYTSLPVKSIYDLSNQGKFPCIKYGRRILFDLQDVDKLMDSLKRPYNLSETVAKKIIGDIHGN